MASQKKTSPRRRRSRNSSEWWTRVPTIAATLVARPRLQVPQQEERPDEQHREEEEGHRGAPAQRAGDDAGLERVGGDDVRRADGVPARHEPDDGHVREREDEREEQGDVEDRR